MNVSQHNTGTVIKGHLLTGISWMIPLIVAAGICISLGQVIGGPDVGQKTGSVPWMLNQIGGWGMGLIVPLISAAIAYSIADRPGFAPGLIVGFILRADSDRVYRRHSRWFSGGLHRTPAASGN